VLEMFRVVLYLVIRLKGEMFSTHCQIVRKLTSRAKYLCNKWLDITEDVAFIIITK
jgi:hypothetical protein